MTDFSPRPALLKHIVDATEVACLLHEADKDVWLASPGLSAMLGRPPIWSQWTNKSWEEKLHGEDSFDFLTAVARLEADQPFASQSLRLRHANGEWRRCRCSGSRHDGTRLLIFCDTTTAQQLEAALLDSQMRLRALYDTTPVAILLWSREGRITDWNHMASETFGHARDAVIGQKLVPLLIHPDEYGRFSETITAVLRTNATQQVTCRTLTADGHELICEWHSVPLRSTKGNLIGIISLAQDVTARTLAEASLRQSRDMAEQLSQSKTEFMATISHELRTPLNGVIGMAQLLRDMVAGDEEREFVRVIEESGTLLLTIINAIVDYTSIDVVRPEESEESFSLGEVLALVVDRFAFKAQQKDVSLDAVIDDSLTDPLIGDARALDKIIASLLDNAIRFTDQGNVHVTAKREFGPEGTAIVQVVIIDSGIGMAPEFVEKHLFTPFKQAADVVVRKHGGIGLGLALAKKLVDRLHGDIKIASQEGVGTSVTLTMPFRMPSLTENS